ncbi:MAG TPA: hypothetical protein VIJ19_10420, partial [Opitutaceae bacterium]
VTLGPDSQLELDFSGFAPTFGEQFDLIDVGNSGTFISGTFEGLAQGSIFNDDGAQFQVSYTGGTGNDLVLTDVSPVPDAATTALLAGLGVAAMVVLRGRRRLIRPLA